MIRFACNCRHIIEAPDDDAGAPMQCPGCGRLLNVPTHDELPALLDDGTYKIDDDVSPLTRVPEPEDLGNDVPEPRRVAPKYDPETGDLIREMPVEQTAPNPPLTIPAPVIPYGRESRFPAWRIVPELFRIGNLAVMFAIILLHLLIHVILVPISMRMLIVVPIVPLILMGVLAHFANVIDEVGPGDRDELPRPFRELSWHDDLGGPCWRFTLALLVCYGPAAVALWLPLDWQPLYLLIVVSIASIIFPAVLLTTTTSGSILNLRPDRVLRVIFACRLSYPILIVLWVSAGTFYFAGLIGTAEFFLNFVFPTVILPIPGNLAVAYAMLLSGIVLMHAFTWRLGLQYRYRFKHFRWTLQAHQRDLQPVVKLQHKPRPR